MTGTHAEDLVQDAARYVNDVQGAPADLDELQTGLKNYPLCHPTRADILHARLATY